MWELKVTIPIGINKRLSRISSNQQIIDEAAPVYQDALKASRHKFNLNYQPEEMPSESSVPKRKCSRKQIYFNPPYSKDVKTNVGKLLLQLMDKHFPPDSYVGLTENSFKDRYTKHKSSFKTRNPKNASGLSRYVWNLEDEKIDFEIKWKIISRAKAYDPGSGVCRLCVREKYFIIFKPNMSTINCRNEVAGPCLHKASRLIGKAWNQLSD